MTQDQLEKLEKISTGVDWHLKQITEIVPILLEVKTLLIEIKSSLAQDTKKELGDLYEKIEVLLANPNPEQRIFSYLKEKLYSDNWPVAVNPDEICQTELEKEIRAENILDLLVGESLENKNIIYFGRDFEYIKKAALKQNCNRIDDHYHEGSYPDHDHVIIYNELEYNSSILNDAWMLMGKNAILHLRVHPWCSRHGINQYRTLNKAYIQLIFDKDELFELGINDDTKLKIIDPEKEYDEIIKNVGFTILDKKITTNKLENFFLDNLAIRNRLKYRFEAAGKELVPYKLSIEFIDYTLKVSM